VRLGHHVIDTIRYLGAGRSIGDTFQPLLVRTSADAVIDARLVHFHMVIFGGKQMRFNDISRWFSQSTGQAIHLGRIFRVLLGQRPYLLLRTALFKGTCEGD
jgi:hypothetical protein